MGVGVGGGCSMIARNTPPLSDELVNCSELAHTDLAMPPPTPMPPPCILFHATAVYG